jgi:hypothetical protein
MTRLLYLSNAASDVLGLNPGTIVGGVFGMAGILAGIFGPPWVKRRQALRTPVLPAMSEGQLERENLRTDLATERAANREFRLQMNAEITRLYQQIDRLSATIRGLDDEVRDVLDGYETGRYPPPPNRRPWPAAGAS